MSLLFLMLACEPDPGGPSDSKGTTGAGSTVTDSDPPTESEPPADQPPGAAVIALTPTVPAAGFDLTVSVVTPAEDPDGDEVSYRYAWTVDGVAAAPSSETVPGALVVDGQVWEVTVTPTAGGLDGPPVSLSALVANQPPSAVGLRTDPVDPVEGQDLTLILDPVAVDPDGDPITTTITWYLDGALVSWFEGLTVIDGVYIDIDEPLRAVVSVTDGFHEPVESAIEVEITYSCSFLPPTHLGDRNLLDARAYHGIVFDDFGNLIGYDGRSSVHKSRYDGSRTLFIPGSDYFQQLDRLPDGDFVAGDATTGELIRFNDAGGQSVIATGLSGIYGVTVGPDGNVYVANGSIYKVIVATGEVQLIYRTSGRWSAHSLNFNLDSTVLYIGIIGTSDLYALDLDTNLDPVNGVPYVYATGVGGGYHDGIGVDTCGNLWVADYSTSGLYRVETNGTVTSIYDVRNSTYYGHGVMFGTGIDGWRTDAIYLPQPYNSSTVREVVIGFESADTVRTWNGVAAPW